MPCGESGDGCGGTLDCGSCPVGYYCNTPICVNLCDGCAPIEIVSTGASCANGVCLLGEGNPQEPFALEVSSSGGLSLPLDPTPFTWTVIAGSLPAGLSLSVTNNAALISGTPSQSGTTSFTLQVEDDVQRTAQQACQITITNGNFDHVLITNATFNQHRASAKGLSVSAIDDNADAVLTVTNTSTGATIGTLTNTGTGTFAGGFHATASNVTVTSSRGATASSAVKVIY